ncbi:hypothetical protein B4098_1343 [Heyndrickxia coagulans]|uniref:Uncharacterized protein n=1 Tax=Heyndrickxia coagulans TaxID=1398 RepID=A0A150KC00_HEYCO|nr:hypothetical protein B4098_1343 [Heyndrickxia coagulans]KYC72976.1 hypothetical protein B4099_1432 [Heyndrickxia coagulans]
MSNRTEKRRDPIKGVSRRFYFILKWHTLRLPCLKMNVC